MKRLYRSRTDQKWAGVCAGVAQYFEVDPTFVRAAYAFVTIITGVLPGLLAYLVLTWIIPTESEVKSSGKKKR